MIIISGTTREIFTKIFVHVACGRGSVPRSSSGVVAIHYVLPVLWMTSCLFFNGPYNGMNFATKDRFR